MKPRYSELVATNVASPLALRYIEVSLFLLKKVLLSAT